MDGTSRQDSELSTGSVDPATSAAERARFHAELQSGTRRLVIWTVLLFVPMYLAWWGFDWVLAPEHVWHFLAVRLATASLLLLFLIPPFALKTWDRHGYAWFAALILVFCYGISPMLPAVSDEVLLPYVIGSVLPLFGGYVIVTWSWRWSAAMLGAVLLGNAGALALFPGEARPRTLVAAAFAWLSIALIGLGASVFKYSYARREFDARLAQERERQRADEARAEAVQAKEQVESMLLQLRELDQQKTLFFQNVSHELRTPLTVLLAPLEALAKQADEATLPKLEMIERNAHRLLRLVNQLLDFARLEAGKASVRPEPHSPKRLVEPIVEGFEAFARSKGLTLDLRAADDLPPALVSADDFDKVMCNLLSNACKFTNPGGSVVVRVDAETEWVRVAVKDTGIGISDTDLPKVFERFRQVDEQASRRYEGSGIGLALAKELVEAGGGRLEVESERGIGSTFTVYLPRTTERPLSLPPPPDRPSLPASRSRASSSVLALEAEVGARRNRDLPEVQLEQQENAADDAERPLLLVVEDNADMRSLVADVCGADFRIAQACDGREGLTLAEELSPAIIVSDVMMPGMDGNELLRELRANPKTAPIPVVLLTAKAGKDQRLEALDQGADDYLGKPFEPRELLSRLRSLMRLRSLELELREVNRQLESRVVEQSVALERARHLGRYLPPEVAHAVAEQGQLPALERRRVTVFRLELRGFERATRAAEPEDVAAMLSAHLSTVVDVAFSHGGTIERFDRDRVHGFFGAPEPLEPNLGASRAWTMAEQLRVRLAELCEQFAIGDAARPVVTIALASGTATVGAFGSPQRLEYAAVGGVCDQAEALLAAAEAGTICCSEPTWKLLGREVPGIESRAVRGPAGETLRVWSLPPLNASADSAEARSAEVLGDTQPAEVSGETDRDPEPGALLGGRYRILHEMGAGGMGRVYRAHDEKLAVDVAIKLLIARDHAGTDSFRREVRLARLVTHRNVARIHDIGEWHGREFVSMECLDGEGLDDRLGREGMLPLDVARDLLLQLCEGLGAAHAVGVVHRDLKPSNVFLERSGRLVILDFGIARALDRAPSKGTDTRGFVGTPHYMAPEQFFGRGVDVRTDLYALGAVAFEMITGVLVFDADNVTDLAFKHVHETPPDPSVIRPELSARMRAVVMRCLAKEPGDRFASAAEVKALLT